MCVCVWRLWITVCNHVKGHTHTHMHADTHAHTHIKLEFGKDQIIQLTELNESLISSNLPCVFS